MITVKCEHESDYRRFTIDGDSSFLELKDKVASLFKIDNFAIKYKDQEGDWITISTDMELQESIKNNVGTLKLSVIAAGPAEKRDAVDSQQLQQALLKLVDTQEFKDRFFGLIKELIVSDSLKQVVTVPENQQEPLTTVSTQSDEDKAKEILGDDAVVIHESVNLQPIEPIAEVEASIKEEAPAPLEPDVTKLQHNAETNGLGIVPQLGSANAPNVVISTSAIQLPEPTKLQDIEKGPEPPVAYAEQDKSRIGESPSTFMRATEAIGAPIMNMIEAFISPKPTPDPKWNAALQQLKDMGFTDVKKNVELLEKHGGSVEQVLDILLSQA